MTSSPNHSARSPESISAGQNSASHTAHPDQHHQVTGDVSRGPVGRVFAVAALSVVGILGVDSLYRSYRADKYEETWGSLSLPSFTTQTSSSNFADTTFSRFLSHQRRHFEQLMQMFASVEQDCDALSRRVQALESATAPISKMEWELVQSEMLRLRSAIALSELPEHMPESALSATFEARHGDVIAYAKELFKRTTGKELPDSVIFTESSLGTEKAGEVRHFSENIRYTRGAYARTLGTLLHELGHLTYVRGEAEQSSAIPFGLGAHRDEVSIAEECAAELFRLAALSNSDDPELQNQVGPLEFSRIQEWLAGSADTSWHHNEGFSVADAYLEFAGGDPALAYRIMTSEVSIRSEVASILERNRQLLTAGPSLEEATARMIRRHAEVQTKVDGLATLIEALGGDDRFPRADVNK